MKLNKINLMLFVLAKYYSKRNQYDVAHFHARGILTAIVSFLLLSLKIIAEKLNFDVNIAYFMQSRLTAAILLLPIFLFITFISPSAKTMSTITIDEAEQKRGWYSFWALLVFTVSLFLLSVYVKHGVIVKL